MARHDGKGASRGLSPLFLGKAKSAMCESCFQERDQWLIGKRPHFGPQIFTERGGRKTEPFWGPPRLVQHRTGCPKTTPFFQNRCAPGRRQLGHFSAPTLPLTTALLFSASTHWKHCLSTWMTTFYWVMDSYAWPLRLCPSARVQILVPGFSGLAPAGALHSRSGRGNSKSTQ